jgi:hypothetical protein
MILTSKDAFLALNDVKLQEVQLDDDNSVYIRMLSSGERMELLRSFQTDPGDKLVAERIVALCACDEMGRRMFSDEDLERLATHSYLLIEKLATAALKLNGLHKDAVELEKKDSAPITQDG